MPRLASTLVTAVAAPLNDAGAWVCSATCLARSSAITLLLSRSIMPTMSDSGGDLTAAIVAAPAPAAPAPAAPAPAAPPPSGAAPAVPGRGAPGRGGGQSVATDQRYAPTAPTLVRDPNAPPRAQPANRAEFLEKLHGPILLDRKSTRL